jgi:hypothetical protein
VDRVQGTIIVIVKAVELRKKHNWKGAMRETNGRGLYNIFICLDINLRLPLLHPPPCW